jgi:GT2 family glycosyltransferase
MEWPTVSVVVLNYNGKQHLKDCFVSLRALNYPRERCELILVDNASTDNSVDFIRENFSEVRIIQNETNLGFAHGNNNGARAAAGKYVAFLNNDVYVDSTWLSEMVLAATQRSSIICVGSKMVSWDGKLIDFVKPLINFYGFGYQDAMGWPDHGQFDKPVPLPFACGGAMMIERQIFLESGGFDEDYFLFFEDVDVGWRMWVLGYEVVLAPKALAYHRQHATTDAVYNYRKNFLFERNALYTLVKNYEQTTLHHLLPVALLLITRRTVEHMERFGLDPQSFHTLHAAPPNDIEGVTRTSLSGLFAMNELALNIDKVLQKRIWIQAHRRRSDVEILSIFGQPTRPHILAPDDREYVWHQLTLTRAFGLNDVLRHVSRKVLFVTNSKVLPETPVAQLGLALTARGHHVLYAAPVSHIGANTSPTHSDLLAWEPQRVGELIQQIVPDVTLVTHPNLLEHLRVTVPTPLVLDLTDTNSSLSQIEKFSDMISQVDAFLCRSTEQLAYIRDWLAHDNHAGGNLVPLDKALWLIASAEERVECLDMFCRQPFFRIRPTGILHPQASATAQTLPTKTLGMLIDEAIAHYRRGGLSRLFTETIGFIKRRLVARGI